MSEQVGKDGFRVSTFSGGGNCVAVGRRADGRVVVRQSKDPEHELGFTADEWDAFVRGVKDGQFDSM